jgi:glutamate-1-semialdehyde 2,1-aminomutase
VKHLAEPDVVHLDALGEWLRALVHLQLRNEGFVTARHGLLCQHVMTGPTVVDAFVEAYGNTLDLLAPYLSRHHPELLVHAGARP